MNYTETVAAFLESPDWTYGEKWVIRWQHGQLGHFHAALAEAIARADDNNLRLLSLGFPQEVDAFLAWNRGNLSTRLHEAGLSL